MTIFTKIMNSLAENIRTREDSYVAFVRNEYKKDFKHIGDNPKDCELFIESVRHEQR